MRTTSSSTTRTIWLCFAAAIIEGIDLQAAAIAAPKMAPALGLDSTTLGWVFSASTFGLMLGAIIGGYCADRLGRKRVLVMSMLILAIFSLSTTLCSQFSSLLLMRFLTGLGLGGAMPTLIALTAENTPDASRGRWTALMYGGIPVGTALDSWITLVYGDDWRTLFFVGGIAPLVVAPLLAWALPESRRFESIRHTREVGLGGIKAVLGAHQVLTTLLLWITASCTLLVIYSVFNWLPTLLLGIGLRATQVAGVVLALGLGGMAGTLLIGLLLDSRWRVLSLGAVYGLVTVLLALFANTSLTMSMVVVLGFLMGATLQSTTAMLFAIAPLCYDTAHRSTGVGAAVAAGRIGAIVGPIIVGALLSKGTSVANVLLSMMPITVLAMICAAWVTMRSERLGRALR